MDEKSRSLWARVCATVNKLGSPRSPRVQPVQVSIPSDTLDLHGHTVHDAFFATRDFINRSDANRTLVIITGKSGRIRTEFTDWLWQFERVQSYKELNGGGAFEIRLKKK